MVVLILVVLALVGLGFIAYAGFKDDLTSGPDGAGDDGFPAPRARAVLGVLATLVSLWLPWSVWRNRDEITHVLTVRGTYYSGSIGTIVMSILAIPMWFPTGFGVTALGLVSLVATALVRRVPREAQRLPRASTTR